MVKSTLAVFAASLLITIPAGTQAPQQHLEETRRLLHDLPVPADAGAAKRVAALQQDFNAFASEYLLQNARGAAADTPDAADRPADWRSRYLLVEADLAALLGPAGAPEGAGAAAVSLDPQLRDRLQQIRTHLQTFYAATIQSREGNPVAHTGPAPNEQAPVAPTTAAPQTPPPVKPRTEAPDAAQPSSAVPAPPPCAGAAAAAPAAGIDSSTAVQLLDRVQSVLDAAAKGESPTSLTAVGTSGTKGAKAAGGKVTLDRGLVDEIRAELTQMRTLLKP